MAGPPVAPPRPPWTGAQWLGGLLVGGVIVACDAWVKITARIAACPETPSIREAVDQLWTVPRGCTPADFLGFAQLSPVARDGGPLGLAAGSLEGATGRLWAYGLLAVAALISVLVVRWRWRSTGDAIALGVLLGSVTALVLPRLLGDGGGLAELHVGGLATGLGDVGLLWAAIWLGWRAIAEARA